MTWCGAGKICISDHADTPATAMIRRQINVILRFIRICSTITYSCAHGRKNLSPSRQNHAYC
jgi:hypothetical protein